MDDVDNSVTGTSTSAEAGGSVSEGEPPFQDPSLRGADLARAALQAAREQTKTRGRGRPRKKAAGTGVRRRRGWSGPGTDDRDPQPLGRVASRIAADHGWAERLVAGQVFGRWAALVGDDVAEHTKPVALQEGVLTVQAESTAWATQLRLLQRQILARIADALGKDTVRRLRVQGPAAPSWRYGPRHISGRGPRDTYG
nr:DciA family protein [Halopolyspora algeriensis]